jgi:hypothetical protein
VTVSGVPNRFGFFELYRPNGCDASVLLRDLGTAFRGEALSYSRIGVPLSVARAPARGATRMSSKFA